MHISTQQHLSTMHMDELITQLHGGDSWYKGPEVGTLDVVKPEQREG